VTPESMWLVITENGLFAALPDRTRAEQVAQSVAGVVCGVPIVADFRRPRRDRD